ncbi:unnamed protein product [Acanthoscelides obtectus]|uniref:PiggyBac transposable element-derived protein domain-containing protein n=1 Tax=Acanthoscelides obtectus TaxID=200917 RepID=A0A9P0LVB8_ACAOB|nr:unnamed protein product [Acanthoscelides obtectus]CAK1679594.1 hypothetical protein AOBTE_LOCUS32376 [Acanthoscelides obtectus]
MAKTPLECFFLFIDEVMIVDIVKNTNLRIIEKSEKWKESPHYGETNPAEIKAVLGLLYLSGVFKNNHRFLYELWNTDGTVSSTFSYLFGLRLLRRSLKLNVCPVIVFDFNVIVALVLAFRFFSVSLFQPLDERRSFIVDLLADLFRHIIVDKNCMLETLFLLYRNETDRLHILQPPFYSTDDNEVP